MGRGRPRPKGIAMNKQTNKHPIRKTSRLLSYDYSSDGVYHVIICSRSKRCIFGTIECGQVCLSREDEIVDKAIRALPEHYPEVKILTYIIMPNHVHILLGIGVTISGKDFFDISFDKGSDTHHTLGQIIGSMKSYASKEAASGLWQSRFYEHIIREQQDYISTIEYIQNNPMKWERDEFYI